MEIRRAAIEDIPELIVVARQYETASHWTEKQYEAALKDPAPARLILVLASAKIAGFAVASQVEGEWELENIVVAPDCLRRGFGTQLLEGVVTEARRQQGRVMFLEVRESNTGARRLYEKAGFRVNGKRPGYYHNPPEDAILYKKFLSVSAPEIG